MIFGITTFSLVLTALLSGVTAEFNCNGVSSIGFQPSCCVGMDGQVGLNCIPANQMGETNPTWECNLLVYNLQGCCQSINYTNPSTQMSIWLCSLEVGS